MKKNCYIEYKSRGDLYENLSPEEYLDLIRPYLRDLINEHETPMKADTAINTDTKFGEWKIRLVMLIVFLLKILKKLVLRIQLVK